MKNINIEMLRDKFELIPLHIHAERVKPDKAPAVPKNQKELLTLLTALPETHRVVE